MCGKCFALISLLSIPPNHNSQNQPLMVFSTHAFGTRAVCHTLLSWHVQVLCAGCACHILSVRNSSSHTHNSAQCERFGEILVQVCTACCHHATFQTDFSHMNCKIILRVVRHLELAVAQEISSSFCPTQPVLFSHVFGDSRVTCMTNEASFQPKLLSIEAVPRKKRPSVERIGRKKAKHKTFKLHGTQFSLVQLSTSKTPNKRKSQAAAFVKPSATDRHSLSGELFHNQVKCELQNVGHFNHCIRFDTVLCEECCAICTRRSSSTTDCQ